MIKLKATLFAKSCSLLVFISTYYLCSLPSYKHGFEEDSDLDEIDYDGDMDEDEVDDCCEYCCTDEQHFEKTMLFQDTTACKPQSGAGGGGLKLRLPQALSSCCSSKSKKHHTSHADLATTPKSTCSSLPSEKSGGG